MAQNILNDSFRRIPHLGQVEADLFEKTEAPTHDAEPPRPSARMKLLCEALDQLTEREREVLLVSYTWYRPGEQLTIPDAELKKLASDYQTTPTNLRQIRARAKKKIEEYITMHGGRS